MHIRKRSYEMDMTQGSILPKMLLFAVPLILSSVLQLLFNAADVIVVGQFDGANALAAVGSTGALINLIVNVFLGLSVGTNVVVARYYGAGKVRETSDTIHTSIAVSLVGGVFLAIFGFFLSRTFLEWMGSPEEVLPLATIYTQIYFIGMPVNVLYNFGSAVLRAIGDTRRPLIYLAIAGVVNVILNLFFVIVCKMAADGVALASVISQYVSAILVVWHMMRLNDACKFYFQRLRFHGDEVGRILGLGVPAGIQHMIFAIANLFIQAAVNSFDSTMVSGNAAAANTDTIIYNIMMAFYTACSTFMGQNWGAGHKKRMMDSYLISLFYAFAVAAVLGVAFYFAGRPFLYVFTNSADVVEAGMQRMKIMCFSYAISAFMDNTIAACRGLGRTIVPTVVVIMGSCVFRVIWVYTIFAHYHTIPSLYLLYAFSWTITAAAEIVYFLRCFRKLRLVPETA